MPALRAGTVQGASVAGAPFSGIDMVWDDVVIPSGWALDAGAATYTAEGMYPTGASGVATFSYDLGANAVIEDRLIMIGMDIVSYGTASFFNFELQTDAGVGRAQIHNDALGTDAYEFDITTALSALNIPTGSTGFTVLALYLDASSGDVTSYLFDGDGVTITDETTNIGAVSGQLAGKLFFDLGADTEGEYLIRNIFVNGNNAFTPTDIEAKAHEWGWVSATAVIAEAFDDADWTGLAAPPGAWTLSSGTPTYDVAGTEVAAAAVFAVSATGNDDDPATLLVQYEFDDEDAVGIEIRIQNGAGTSYLEATLAGGGGELAVTGTRVEAGPLNCSTLPYPIPTTGPGTGWFGTRMVSPVDVPTYNIPEAFHYITGEIDSLPFSGDACTADFPTGFTAAAADNVRLSLTDSVGNAFRVTRTIVWNRRLDDIELQAVIEFLGWTP